MTTTRTIEVIVSPAGETTIQTKGFVGSQCQQASRFLEQALGKQAVERLTAEFYLPPQTQAQQNQLREGQ